ncbi:unnamed protein product [Echinostoma caproni]|uniref:Intraflagellar transport protein 122 homolog n=1 Tax=Echinostoma caproni TaxID=27848 RepID=A0A183AWE0_9TREM|nr:unnamed protein product [Echinostoma caproni]
MDGDFQFEDDLFEESKTSFRPEDVQYIAKCSGTLAFLNAPDAESQKAACDWLYLHGRYAECMRLADQLLGSEIHYSLAHFVVDSHVDDVGGFLKKAYIDCKASAIVSKEDLISHFLLHRDCSRQKKDAYGELPFDWLS